MRRSRKSRARTMDGGGNCSEPSWKGTERHRQQGSRWLQRQPTRPAPVAPARLPAGSQQLPLHSHSPRPPPLARPRAPSLLHQLQSTVPLRRWRVPSPPLSASRGESAIPMRMVTQCRQRAAAAAAASSSRRKQKDSSTAAQKRKGVASKLRTACCCGQRAHLDELAVEGRPEVNVP